MRGQHQDAGQTKRWNLHQWVAESGAVPEAQRRALCRAPLCAKTPNPRVHSGGSGRNSRGFLVLGHGVH
jgi:hypothetical protein